MHGSEIQAKYGNNAWRICMFCTRKILRICTFCIRKILRTRSVSMTNLRSQMANWWVPIDGKLRPSIHSIHGSAVATSISIPRSAAAAEGRDPRSTAAEGSDRSKAAIDGGRRPASGRVEPAEHEPVQRRQLR